MKQTASILLCIVIWCSCSRGKYYISSTFRKYDNSEIQSVELDSTYNFYLREVYEDKNEKNENILKTNVDKKDTANKKRIEVEYLLLSWAHQNAIYITTVPDKYQNYYASNFIADTLINAYDFSTFYFGKITDDGESIFFISNNGKKVITWDIRPFITGKFSNKLSIREIAVQKNDQVENVILLNKALEEPVAFSHQNNFTIIFATPGKKPMINSDCLEFCKLKDHKIYFNAGIHGSNIYFRFDKNIPDSKDSVIRFDYHRTRYAPLRDLH